MKHLVTSLAELDAYGITFISLRDNLDLSTPSGRMMMQLLGAMAEFERALIQERVRAGLRNAKSKGVRLGRPMRFQREVRAGLSVVSAPRLQRIGIIIVPPMARVEYIRFIFAINGVVLLVTCPRDAG